MDIVRVIKNCTGEIQVELDEIGWKFELKITGLNRNEKLW